MDRVAILIETSKLGGNKIPGAQADVTLLENYLMSNIGGAWERKEIKTLHNPSYNEITDTINNTKADGYAFISYSGHGYHSKELDMTRVCTYKPRADDPYWMPIDKLKPNCCRFLLSIDCCRNLESDLILEEKIAGMEGAGARAERPPRFKYRELFDRLIVKAEKGGITLYSCDLEESAGETRIGGYFTRGLTIAGKKNEPNTSEKGLYLPIDKAFNISCKYVQSKNKNQHPQAEFGRRLRYYPWAVYPSI